MSLSVKTIPQKYSQNTKFSRMTFVLGTHIFLNMYTSSGLYFILNDISGCTGWADLKISLWKICVRLVPTCYKCDGLIKASLYPKTSVTYCVY